MDESDLIGRARSNRGAKFEILMQLTCRHAGYELLQRIVSQLVEEGEKLEQEVATLNEERAAAEKLRQTTVDEFTEDTPITIRILFNQTANTREPLCPLR